MSKALKALNKSAQAQVQKDYTNANVAYFAPFLRVSSDQQIVEGIASSEAVDSYGDIVRASAIKDALPDYMKFANLRSMHGNIASGTVIEAKVDEEQKITYITAKVVDDAEWKKVKEKVYKGFSIGGIIEEWEPIMVEVADKDGNKHEVFTGGFEITKIKLVEISLVDRPACPDALISAYKAAKLRKFDTKDGIVDQEESFVPSVVLQPDLTKVGKELDTTSSPSSMKTLKKSNPLSILAPRTMSQKITKAQMQTVADDAIKAAKKAAGISDDKQDELMTLSRGEIMKAAEELVAEVVDSLAVFVKAEGVETSSEGADQSTEETSETTEVATEDKEASEDVETTGTEETTETSEEAVVEEKKEDVAETKEETETEEVKVEAKEEAVAEKSDNTSAIVDALKALGETIKKSNEDTVAEIKKSNGEVTASFTKFAKKAGASVQSDDSQVVEEETEEETSTSKAFGKNDPWAKKIA